MRPLDEYIKGWEERGDRARAARRERAKAARGLVPRLVECLVDRYGARRVWLTGSLVAGGFHERSDIDLMVEGIEGAAIYRAGADLDELAAPEFRVDLIPAEDAYPEVRTKAERHGELLYGD